MSKVKVAFMVLVAIVAISAVASAAASAAEAGWMVEGKNLAAGVREEVNPVVGKDVNYFLSGGGVEVECTTLKVESGYIEGTNKNGAKSLLFSGCTAKTANCVLSNAAISTLPVLSEATLDPPNALAAVVVFKPEGTVFATFKFEGEKCSLAGVKAVSGTQAVLAPNGADENTEHLVTAIELKAGELKIGSAAAKLTGAGILSLKSGKPWSFL